MNILAVLGLNFFLISLIAIGGVSAAIPEIHRVFVDQLHLLSEQQFANLFALSQAAPGPNLLFIGLFGWQIAGLSGSLISLLALCGPTLLMAIAFEKVGSKYHKTPYYKALKNGLAPIAIGLLISTADLLITTHFDWRLFALTVSSIFVFYKWKVNSIFVILIGALLGSLGLFN